jgi:hypothetical protein
VSKDQAAHEPAKPEQGDDAASADTAKNAKGCGLGCGGALFALLVLVIAFSCSGGSEDEWEPTSAEARVVCEDWVRAKLKSPASADFGSVNASGAGNGPYTVTGTVDAENSFGASLRTAWTCDVRWDASTERWRGSAVLIE